MLGQCGPGSNGNEGVLHIAQSPSITGTSPSGCLVSYIRTLIGGGSYILQPWATGLVGFYGISTIEGYLMPNPLYTYILNIYIC